MPDEIPADAPQPVPVRRNKGGRPRGSTKRTVPHAGAPMSAQQIADLAARVAAEAAQSVVEKLMGDRKPTPRMVMPPPRVGAAHAAAEEGGEDFDPLDPRVQRAARSRLARPGEVPRAEGLSDEEVLEMFQGEELGEFDVPREIIPDGMAYGWKLKSALGREDSGYQGELHRRGWVSVLHEDHPGVFGTKDETGPILRKGLQLMRRPAEMEELRQRYYRLLAKQAVRDKIAQMASAPPGTGPRTHKDVAPRISRTYEPLPIEG